MERVDEFMTTHILSVSAYYHDNAACLIHDDYIVLISDHAIAFRPAAIFYFSGSQLALFQDVCLDRLHRVTTGGAEQKNARDSYGAGCPSQGTCVALNSRPHCHRT